MKLGAASVMIAGVVLLAGMSHGAEGDAPKSEKEKASYAIGAQMGSTVKERFPDLDEEVFLKGVRDGFSGKKLLLDDKEMSATMTAVQREMLMKEAQAFKEAAERNKKEGEAFLAENKKKAGVVTLPSGLQYRVINEGTGDTPKGTDTVTVNHRGTLLNGNEFDNSYLQKKPATFTVSSAIKGLSEALQLMKVGAKWQLFIPPELAYGKEPHGPIGPNATFIFDVELLSVGREKSSGCKEPGCTAAAHEEGH
jgi:FKBP-type peptidyl-prolyl cis-trans isomerase FklB